MTTEPANESKRNRFGDEVVEFLVRIEKSLNNDLELRAQRDRTSKVEIVRRALRMYLTK